MLIQIERDFVSAGIVKCYVSVKFLGRYKDVTKINRGTQKHIANNLNEETLRLKADARVVAR